MLCYAIKRATPRQQMTKPPSVLYHYTTQRGLLGILETDSIWATKIHYLNDSSEYQLAVDVANDVLHALLKGERGTKKRTKIKCLLDNLRSIEQMNVCVCSFSEHGDRLSQWRAYAHEASGFSVGFHSEQVEHQAKSQDFSLVRCIYDEKQQRDLIEETVLTSLGQDFNTTPSRVDPEQPRTFFVLATGGDFARRFAQLAPLIKSPAFHEEAEWRLISTKGVDVRTMSFRPGKSMLIPYVQFRLGSDKMKYLHSLTVGPTPHRQLAEYAANSLLARWAVAHSPKVHSSKAPYRTW
jgi:hypothetical protein